MATFRDDLARVGRRLLESVEQRTGREVVPRERLELLESAESDNRVLRKTLDFIGFSLLNFQPGVPGAAGGYELNQQARRFVALQALRAWIEDPMAGQQVDLYVSFVFGRGVPRPQAHDAEVQKKLDEAWDDDANRRILTSFEKLVEKGVDLCIQSNVLFTFFDDGEDGMVRTSLLRFDDVVDVVRHSDVAAAGKGDRFRILYYRVLERAGGYDYATGTRNLPAVEGDATARTVYYEAWDAFDDNDPVKAKQDEGLKRAPDSMLRPGKVVHLAVNKTSEMAFGVPRMQRLLRWFTAYNETLESHVNRMKAMASVYMKQTARGTQRDLDRLAFMATGRPSAFGSAQDVEAPTPRGPGILQQNESLNWEPFKIDSGAADVQASAPIIRGQIGGPWPDHYMSGSADGALAGATAMELPVLKFVEREQELWANVFRALGQAQIDAALRVGDLTEWRDATEAELEQIKAAQDAGEPLPLEVNGQGQVKRDLSFEIALPSPLKRAMGDLVTAAVDTATAVDPNGQNLELSRWLLGFILAEAFDVEDPQRIVDQVLPRHVAQAAAQGDVVIDPQTGQPVPPAPADQPGAVGADGQRHTEANPYGAPRNSPPPEQRPIQEAVRDRGRQAAMRASSDRRRRVVEAFRVDVEQVAAEHLARLAPTATAASLNGHGSNGEA